MPIFLEIMLIMTAAACAIMVFNNVCDKIFSEATPAKESFELINSPWLKAIAMMAYISVVEECLFRWLLIGQGERIVGLTAAVVISIVLFMTAHLPNSSQKLRMVCIHLGSGSLLTYLYLHYGLSWAIFGHFYYNMLTVVINRTIWRIWPEQKAQTMRKIGLRPAVDFRPYESDLTRVLGIDSLGPDAIKPIEPDKL